MSEKSNLQKAATAATQNLSLKLMPVPPAEGCSTV